MRRGPRTLLIFTLLLLPCLLAGCWGQKQISDLVVVVGAGIDTLPPDEEGSSDILLTVELANIKQQDTEGSPYLLSARGPTVLAAMRNLSQSLNKQLHWSHMQLLLIGEDAARLGVERYLSLFHNHWEMSPHIYLALCEGEARVALAQQAGLAAYAAGGLHDILAQQKNSGSGYIMPLSLQGYMSAYALPQSGLLVPLVGLQEANVAEVGTGAKGSVQLYLAGMAVLDAESRYAGRLVDEENSGAALILNQARKFALVVEEPNMRQKISLELISWRVKRQWEFDEAAGKMRLILNCQAQASFEEEQVAIRYNDQAAVRRLEELLSAELQRQIAAAWQRAQVMEVDFLGLGQELYSHYTGEWEALQAEWPQVLRRVELVVNIESKVDLSGQSQ